MSADYYQQPIPCPSCGGARCDDGRRSAEKRHTDDAVTYYRCRLCSHTWKLMRVDVQTIVDEHCVLSLIACEYARLLGAEYQAKLEDAIAHCRH